ncbi:hypothetical protein [Nocardioides panzhihuensis]|uniref:Cytoskeletal protein RodZ n=1 Tax=Nocardioides panzhihuensis TaxID=860243 RepID=A0A7Z0ITC8_9ACTN|nr:hypothetical protein [Nocardioides panzhihuensis]NYI79009.1 cytoskeletal protein RodZ [Nocardioides panzhihuensis]
MKWPLLLALILVLATLIWFFFGRPIRKDAKTGDRAETDHSSPEATSTPVAAAADPAEAAETEKAADADADTAAVVAEAESVVAAAAADTEASEAEEATTAPVDTEPEVVPVAEAPAATDGAPYAGAVLPAADGTSSDAAYDIKGSSGKKYHTTASPYYSRTKAAVYFDSEESAEAAGFIAGFKKKVDA